MKIAIASDHGGFDVKEQVRKLLAKHHVDVIDLGCQDKKAVDYPDFADAVARQVSSGQADQGILVCTTGIGMSIAANRHPGVRAALCLLPEMAETARTHNNANVLVMGGSLITPEVARQIVERWLACTFSGAERHARRIDKIEHLGTVSGRLAHLSRSDAEMAAIIEREERRQQANINLIASENYASRAINEAQGSVLTNKYAEGYPGKRWYNGCEFVDQAEQLAIDRARRIFGAEHANVQPHCGSSANLAVYLSVLHPGDTVLAMSLDQGGHLTHGHKLNISGRLYRFVPYGVRRDTEQIDYDDLARIARECKPRLIVAGASAYPRRLDFAAFRKIADEVGALLMVDMAHIAGLIAGGCHPSPVPHAEFVTSTTHKTLRGPRSGLILCREKFGAEVDKLVFPGTQGGPLMHTIAAKAVCFGEALQPAFKDYARQIVANAARLAQVLAADGCRLVSGGTDNHLMLVDLTPLNLTGKDAAVVLERAGIIVNKNAIPFDSKSAFVTSGVRIGTPAVTTRGMKEREMETIGGLILRAFRSPTDDAALAKIRGEAEELAARFPAP